MQFIIFIVYSYILFISQGGYQYDVYQLSPFICTLPLSIYYFSFFLPNPLLFYSPYISLQRRGFCVLQTCYCLCKARSSIWILSSFLSSNDDDNSKINENNNNNHFYYYCCFINIIFSIIVNKPDIDIKL